MSFSVLDTTGATKTINRKDKITSIDGENYEFYVIDIVPFAHGITRARPRILHKTPIVISPYSALNPDNSISYGASYTVLGQIAWGDAGKFEPNKSANTLVAKGHISFQPVVTGQSRGLFMARFSDKLQGDFVEDVWEVKFYANVVTKDSRGQITAGTSTPKTLTCDMVQATLGFVTIDNVQLKSGMAMIKITRDQLTEAEMYGKDNYFTLSLNGATPVKYRIWNTGAVTSLDGTSSHGVIINQTNHYHIYLMRAMV